VEAFLGVALIVGLFVAYVVQRREKTKPLPVPPPMAEAIAEAVPTPRGSSPNWGAPILFCGLLYGAATAGVWWSVLWQVLYFVLVALGAYTAFSAKEFAGELKRDPATTRREHYLKFAVPYVLVPVIAWVLAIPVGWTSAALLPALPWVLLIAIGLVAVLAPGKKS
jgi:uncharacterized protein YneF (UPF0154 family)